MEFFKTFKGAFSKSQILLSCLVLSFFLIPWSAKAVNFSSGQLVKVQGSDTIWNLMGDKVYTLPSALQTEEETAYRQAIMGSYGWIMDQVVYILQSQLESKVGSGNVTIKAGTQYLIRTASNSQLYRISSDNYITPVSKADYSSYTEVIVPDVYWPNYKEINIVLTSPAGGETFEVGQKVTINWSQANVNSINISYYSGAVGDTIVLGKAVDINNTTGSYEWTVPKLPTQSNYSIRIQGVNAGIASKTVDSGLFTIKNVGAKTNIISNVRVTSSSKREIIVEWDTNIAEKSSIYWSPSVCNIYTDMSSDKTTDPTNRTKHKVYLGASSYEKICYQLEDSSGNRTEVLTFSKPTADDMQISDLNLTPTSKSIKIKWQTNLPARSAVYLKDFSSTVNFYNSDKIVSDSNLSTSHEAFFDGLTANKFYKFRIENITNDGKLATNLFTGTDSFSTLVSDSLPDLTVTDIKFTGTKQNEIGTLSATIKNLGTDLASSSGLTKFDENFTQQNFIFTDQPNNITSYKTDRVLPSASNPLKNGETITYSWTGKFNNSGNLSLKFAIDFWSELAETNENNNYLVKVISINGTSILNKPDLTISDIKFESPNNKKGEKGTLSVVIKNLGGNLTSSSGLLNWYNNFGDQHFTYSAESATSVITYKTDRSLPTETNPLKTNETITFSWYGYFDNFGNLSIIYVVDNTNSLAESNENNNTFEKTINVSNDNISTSNIISEQVKCVFKGSQTKQKCYIAAENNNLSCSGKETCVINVNRAKGEKVIWKSTCGGYAYTVMDGQDEYAGFDCTSAMIKINDTAKDIVDNKYDNILSELKQLRDAVKEQQTEIKYLKSMAADLRKISNQMKSAINDFITYGVDANTVKLGAGERAAVINSYKAAFSKLPETEAELIDAIKIANGRFPSLISDKAEKAAKDQFIKIYQRIPDLNDAKDNAAIKVMTYGLRQKAENRNLNSEKAGIKIFKAIYGYNPKTTADWNTMQAITYSGAAREKDSDGDLLSDEMEAQYGTNPNKADTDGDGFKDGTEVLNGYDPLKK